MAISTGTTTETGKTSTGSIFQKICDHIQLHTGYKVTFANDEELDGEDRNETRGVLRINTADRGYNRDAITENFNMFVEFSVVLSEESKFVDTMRQYMEDWQSYSMDLEDGHIYRIYFQTIQPINNVQRISGVKFSTYVLQFTLNLYDNAMFSDDVQIKINGNILQGVMQYSEASKFQRDSHLIGTSNVPAAIGCTKVRTYNVVFMPIVGNEASNDLFEWHNNMLEATISLGVKFPYNDDEATTPVINYEDREVYMEDFSISLQKGTFGQVSVTFTEYSTSL